MQIERKNEETMKLIRFINIRVQWIILIYRKRNNKKKTITTYVIYFSLYALNKFFGAATKNQTNDDDG